MKHFRIILSILITFAFTQSSLVALNLSKLHSPEYVNYLRSLDHKYVLSNKELNKLRETMLNIANEGRSNPRYRQLMGCDINTKLPAQLPPLFLDQRLNKAAQEQAEYLANLGALTHDNHHYRSFADRINRHLYVPFSSEGVGLSAKVSDFPMLWMKAESAHHRPIWNLGRPVNAAGFGVARSKKTGLWFAAVVWAQVR